MTAMAFLCVFLAAGVALIYAVRAELRSAKTERDLAKLIRDIETLGGEEPATAEASMDPSLVLKNPSPDVDLLWGDQAWIDAARRKGRSFR